MNNEKKMVMLQIIGTIGVLLIGSGLYLKVLAEPGITIKFVSEFNHHSTTLIALGIFLVIFYYLYYLYSELKKKS